MSKIKLTDSYYQSFISEKLKNLHYLSLSDFNLIVESLELLIQKQQTQSWIDRAKLLPNILINHANRWFNPNKGLKNQLKIIEDLFKNLDCYVYGEYLLTNPESYEILDGPKNTAFDANQLSQMGQEAFKDILLDNIHRELKKLQKLSPTEKQIIINNVLENDQRNATIKKTMANATLPDLGDERSTATMALVNHCGSMPAFRAFETMLRNTPGVKNLRMSSGLPEFDWTDSMNFNWSVNLMINNSSPHHMGVILNTKEEIDFSHKEHELKIPVNTQRILTMDIWILRQGEPHLKTETILDNLMEKVEIAINMFLMLAIAEKLNKSAAFQQKATSLMLNLPTRERLWDTIISLPEPAMAGLSDLIHVLRQHGIEIEFTDALDVLDASESNSENEEEVESILEDSTPTQYSPIANRTRSQSRGLRPNDNAPEPVARRTRSRFRQ